ncbi:MAG TPA: secondary thiamine-phosphate synthase enzyme YjbQ [Candidatus Deferrimicrobium sp.]|nr:secondary thiamine-phosphate synthase enzyme YjbQ [Candidatus Deferrimicrobium sp.]
MKGYKTINVKTGRYVQFVDITADVRRYVSEAGVKDGIIVVYTPHTTAGITINENADPAVTEDIETFLQKKIPHESYFKHSEGNSPSHIMSSYISASETLIIDKGELLLGTWQGLYFCEFDGPRNRKVHLKIMGDKE